MVLWLSIKTVDSKKTFKKGASKGSPRNIAIDFDVTHFSNWRVFEVIHLSMWTFLEETDFEAIFLRSDLFLKWSISRRSIFQSGLFSRGPIYKVNKFEATLFQSEIFSKCPLFRSDPFSKWSISKWQIFEETNFRCDRFRSDVLFLRSTFFIYFSLLWSKNISMT